MCNTVTAPLPVKEYPQLKPYQLLCKTCHNNKTNKDFGHKAIFTASDALPVAKSFHIERGFLKSREIYLKMLKNGKNKQKTAVNLP